MRLFLRYVQKTTFVLSRITDIMMSFSSLFAFPMAKLLSCQVMVFLLHFQRGSEFQFLVVTQLYGRDETFFKFSVPPCNVLLH